VASADCDVSPDPTRDAFTTRPFERQVAVSDRAQGREYGWQFMSGVPASNVDEFLFSCASPRRSWCRRSTEVWRADRRHGTCLYADYPRRVTPRPCRGTHRM